MKSSRHIAIVGAGLVGSLLSIYLRNRGYKVSVFERRADMRKASTHAGRSINLALSTRGIKALEEVGLAAAIKRAAIPMHGRVIHDRKSNLTFQPYGKEGQFINSISRSDLNVVLMNEAENKGVEFFFDQVCTKADLQNNTLELKHGDVTTVATADIILGADGAFSAIRMAMQVGSRLDFEQDYIDHGYKELHVPAGSDGAFRLEKNALHIWPRESFMLIALPNPDGSFTCTLFLPFAGKQSFEKLQGDAAIADFFEQTFPDAFANMPSLLHDFHSNPTSSLVTMKCYPWVHHHAALIGDAAHAIVPFYGQGMNAGFEDCRVLNRLLDTHNDDWDSALNEFQAIRKPDTDAIASLALDNFIEMRDLVGEPEFLLRKKIEARLHELFPNKWIPLYSMVTFNDGIRYSEAYAIGQKQKRIMDEVMKRPDISSTWQELDFAAIANQLG